MTNFIHSKAFAVQRWKSGPLGPHLDAFARLLEERGYAPAVVPEYIRRVGHLSIWLQRRGFSLAELNEEKVRSHLHAWKRRTGSDVSPAPYKALLAHLRATGVIKQPSPRKLTASDRLVDDYARFLERDRGLAEPTIVYHRLSARRFLGALFGTGPVRFSALTTKRVTQCVLRYSEEHGPICGQHMVTVLRSLLRFLHMRGRVQPDLAQSVPRVARWRLSALPGHLESWQMQRLLRHFDNNTAKGMRDRAIVMLLGCLGLRAGEARMLTLNEIDWTAGRISVCGKGGKRSQLPLPHDVGEAIVRYLRYGRPRCATRRVFVRMRAPHTGLVTSSAIGRLVKRALQRAGLDPPHKGSHLLRHTCATLMLRRGASLSEIGRILRHEDPNSTALYAKVDLDQLRCVAQPWQGGAQ